MTMMLMVGDNVDDDDGGDDNNNDDSVDDTNDEDEDDDGCSVHARGGKMLHKIPYAMCNAINTRNDLHTAQ